MNAKDTSSNRVEGTGVKRKCPFAALEKEFKRINYESDDLEEGELLEECDDGVMEPKSSTLNSVDTNYHDENEASTSQEIVEEDEENTSFQSDELKKKNDSYSDDVHESSASQVEEVTDQETTELGNVSDQTTSEDVKVNDQLLIKTEEVNGQTYSQSEEVSSERSISQSEEVSTERSTSQTEEVSTERSTSQSEEVNSQVSSQSEEVNGHQTPPDDHLRVFHVLSEYDGASENETNKNEHSSSSDISDDEIEAMLEEGLKNKSNTEVPLKDGQKPVHCTEKKIVMLEELGINHFDLLPEGWVQIMHKSGMPLYLHKASRVCTFSRPYYLGQGSARKHLVPLSAIPCLQYKRALEEEKKSKEEESTPATNSPIWLRPAKIETAEENKLSQSLRPFAIQLYCKTLFRFKTAQSLRFVTWSDRRRYAKAKKDEKQQQRPTFPNDTKLIKFPILNPNDGPDAKPLGEWIMNPNGKSYICILHEYVQHALKMQPTYEFKALENPSTPYSATVIISGMKYGYGTGTSKKQAKLAAAKASLEILIPQMREKIRNDTKQGKKCSTEDDEASLSIFDEIKIEDPRVTEFCTKTTEPPPYSILLTCLQRNFDLGEMAIEYKVNSLHRQSNEFIMTVGSHTARVVCKKKKEGKQRASQALLQKLHPHITSWGSLLRLYGNRSLRNVKEKKQEEQEITMLQSKASLNSPNYAILGKLKTEMMKLHDEMTKRKPISIFVPPPDIVLPSSGTQLNKIDL